MTLVYKLKDYSATFKFEKERPREIRWDEKLKLWMLEEHKRCQGIWMKEQDGTLVGEIILTWESSNVVNLENLTVIPTHRRQGIGTKLVDAAIDWAEMSGYKLLAGEARMGASWSLLENIGAHPLFKYENWNGTNEDYMLFKIEI